MGLIRVAKDAVSAGLGSITSSLDSMLWKEYFESGDMSNGILMKRGEKIITGNGKNRHADDNLISSGSGIDIQEGQCMIIVENGAIVEFCAEPGRFTYDSSTQPSLFSGENRGLQALGREILTQWSSGGQRFATQRVYFINMCEQLYTPIKWGCGDISFHHTTMLQNGAPPIELDMTLKGNGELTIRVSDPMLFFRNLGAQKVGGDNDGVIRVSEISSNLKSGLVDKIAEAISIVSTEQPIAYTGLGKVRPEIARHINELLSNEWAGKRGFEICSFTINGALQPTQEDKDTLKEMQVSFGYGANTNAAIFSVQKGYSDGAKAAGSNPNGAANAFMGVGMGGMMGGFGQGMGQMQPTPNAYQQQQYAPAQAAPAPSAAPAAAGWTCACGHTNTGKFCANCGEKKPEPQVAGSWTCACGHTNTGKFCAECGNKKPEKKVLKCDKCGYVLPEGAPVVKFCPECGDVITEADFT